MGRRCEVRARALGGRPVDDSGGDGGFRAFSSTRLPSPACWRTSPMSYAVRVGQGGQAGKTRARGVVGSGTLEGGGRRRPRNGKIPPPDVPKAKRGSNRGESSPARPSHLHFVGVGRRGDGACREEDVSDLRELPSEGILKKTGTRGRS